ncbi:hypothetical protein AGMMS50293_27480 [Spirochaetia bacterium]|nr:hypothetical protein AGMMS50293_27480 [Spirochaetia bacterium]
MQNTRLNEALRALDITTASLSRESGINPALISRYRSGERPLPANGKHLQAICTAAARLSSVSDRPGKLPAAFIELLSLEVDDTDIKLEDVLYSWLKQSKTPQRKKSARPVSFNEKLDVLMNTLEVSNSQLARSINIDSSAISRYRRGRRLPITSSGIIENVSRFFCDLGMKRTHQRIRIMELANLDGGAETLGAESLYKNLYNWFSETDNTDTSGGMAGFLSSVGNFQYSGFTPIPLEQIAPLAAAPEGRESYWGTEGLQKAVIRFLYHVAIQEKPQTLYLHSDQSMAWMIVDPKFTAIWASLMVHTLTRGHTIIIIHAINRDDKELMAAIARWVPLYLIGGIKPYYFRSIEQSRYRNTMFICKEFSCISSSCLAGMEDKTEYLYDTDSRRLSVIQEQFERLLASCNSLSTIFTAKNIQSFIPYESAFWLEESSITALLPSLSLATMPESLLQSMLDRSGLPKETKQKILDYYSKNEKWTLRQIASGKLEELIAIPDNKTIACGKVFTDIPLWILPNPLAYTTEEYQNHLAHIHRLESHNANYRLWPLSANPFQNIKILHKKNIQTLIIKTDTPSGAFFFENPYMCGGFDNFLTALKAKENGADLYGLFAKKDF